MKKPFISIIIFCLFGYVTSLQAQSTIPASGGNASGGGGTVSYTVGQIVYTTNTGTNGTSAQGVQQPYEISVVTSVENDEEVTLECSVYPNPTTDFLTLKIINCDKEKLSYKLYDINGNLIENQNVTGKETQITMENRVSGTYFIKVTDNNKDLKTFKIIKH
jgi:hypothetical protein